MSARNISDTARQFLCTAGRVRYASTSASSREVPEHGRQIFVYNHLQTNQVVYSLTKALNNKDSIAQLPFNGKKTVPSALRKDLWQPLATISFPPGTSSSGLSAYQKLREYRKIHELSWDPSDPLFKDEKGAMLNRRSRGKVLSDQKANTIADMAAVLKEIREGDKKIGLKGIGGEGIVEVKWRELADAEYAREWGEAVEHSTLDRGIFNNRPATTMWKSELAPIEGQEAVEEEVETEPTPELSKEERKALKAANKAAALRLREEAALKRKAAQEKHLEYMASLKGTQQSYSPAPPGRSERATAIRLERSLSPKTIRKTEMEQRVIENAERTAAWKEEQSSKSAAKKAERAERHKKLMDSLKGKTQVYDPRGKAENMKMVREQGEAALTKKQREKEERKEKHRELMESLRGTHQEYEERGKLANNLAARERAAKKEGKGDEKVEM